MLFQVKVRVDLSKMKEFGQKLQMNELDRSCIRGETYCLKDDPAVGFSIWEIDTTEEFETKFATVACILFRSRSERSDYADAGDDGVDAGNIEIGVL